jgi:hypothetical protein
MWEAVAALVDRVPDEAALRHHGLHLLAAGLAAADGRPVSAALCHDRRVMAGLELAAPMVLDAARRAYGGALLLMKGPEAAALWPGAATRPFRDLDLLADDALAAHRALREAGFMETGRPEVYEGIHHLRPLQMPGLPLIVELHERPKWPAGVPAPEPERLRAAGVPSATAVPGLLALPPAEHALVLAAHSWAHVPLARLCQLVDVAAAGHGTGEGEIEALARAWGCARLWRTTRAVTEALTSGGRRPLCLRAWAHHLEHGRERTVLAEHLQRWLSGFAALPPRRALAACAGAVLTDLRPEREEDWSVKLARARAAVGDATLPKSEHDTRLERAPVAAHPAPLTGGPR